MPATGRALQPANLFAINRDGKTRPRIVPDLGEGAFWVKGEKPNGGLHVLGGGCYFIIAVTTGDPAQDLAVAKQLAESALKRLDTGE